MEKHKVIIYRKVDGDLEKSWKSLWQKSENAHFFNSLDFFLTCEKTYPQENYEIYCLKRKGSLIAVLPLIKKSVYGFISYTDPGGRFLEKSSLLVINDDKNILRILIDFILRKGKLHLTELPLSVASNLKDLYPGALISIISVNPYIDFDRENYIGLKKKNLNKLKNRIKKYRNSLKHLHVEKNLSKALDIVLDLEKRSYKSVKGKEIFDEESSKLFYKNLINMCKDSVVVDFLTFDRNPFVSSVGVICKDRYYACHTCYLREYKYLIPGKMLTYFMLKNMKRDGVKTFDFVRGFSKFKEDFTKDFTIQYDFYLSGNGLINAWWKIVNFLRRLRMSIIKTKYSKDYLYLFKSL